MSSEINEALNCWAGETTWFSSHPRDQYNLKEAISCLQGLTTTPTLEQLELEIFDIVKNHPKVLGAPEDIASEVKKIAKEIVLKL